MIESTVFVLGAGVSKQARYPLYSELLSLDYLKSIDEELSQIETSMDYSHLMSSLREDCSYLANYNLHFEELLSKLERQNQSDFERAKTYYHRLLTMAWSLMGENIMHQRNEYIFAFADYLLSSNTDSVVLSFNHDFVLETGIGMIQEGPLQFTYDLPTALSEPLDSFSPPINTFSRKVVLYKLHGSVNWLVCPNCHTIFVGGEDLLILVAGLAESGLRCRRCKNADLQSTLIAPKRIKDYSSMAYQWERASERLRKAHRIIFIGYSMPDYDIEAINFFKHSIMSDSEILVVNPNVTAELRERFKSLPGSRHMCSRISMGELITYIYIWGKPPDGNPL